MTEFKLHMDRLNDNKAFLKLLKTSPELQERVRAELTRIDGPIRESTVTQALAALHAALLAHKEELERKLQKGNA